jgi:protein SCO1/2
LYGVSHTVLFVQESKVFMAKFPFPAHPMSFLLAILSIGMMFFLMACANVAEPEPEQSLDDVIPFQPPTQGTRIDPPRQVADFTLTSGETTPLSLSDLAGKPVMLYFGYTFCPDICPTTLAELVRVKRTLAEQGRGNDVTFVFVSVDGERDTPHVIKTYLAAFDKDFIGLTTDNEQAIRKIGVDYGLFFEKQKVAGTSADYLVDHTAATFLLDSQGRLHTIYGYGTPAEVISTEILALLETEQEPN